MRKNIFIRTAALPARLLLAALLIAAPARAQSRLEVAERQMAAGLTGEARTLVAQALASPRETEPEKAGWLAALLQSAGDSAKKALESFRESSGTPGLKAQALERLGDLYYLQGSFSEAAACWSRSAQGEIEKLDFQRRQVKIARASLRLGRPEEARTVLRRALESGESSQTGIIRYWQGEACLSSGETKTAAAHFSDSYTRPGQPYGLLALYRLNQLYGAGDSPAAGQWRQRWSDSSRETIFGEKYLPSQTVQAGFTIQLGAFSSAERAARLAGSIRSLGLDPVIRSGADRLHRVRLEGIPSRQEAESIISRLKARHIEYQLIAPEG